MGHLDPYIDLLASFVERGSVDARGFEEQFLERFKGDATMFADVEFAVLDRLFGDVDAFEADPGIRGPEHLDEHGLTESATEALARLRELVSR